MVKNTGQDSTTSQHLFCTKSFLASWICDCWLVILLIKENECSCTLCSHWQKSTRVFAYWSDCFGLSVIAAFCCCLSVGDDQAVQQQDCTPLQSRAGRFNFKLYYLLLTSIFYFLKNYFYVANLAIVHRKHVDKSGDHPSWGLAKYGYKPKFFKEQISNHTSTFLTYTHANQI